MSNVSVVIPVLNEERHICRLLECIAVQEFPEFELLIVDGGSQDRTRQIVSDFAHTHDKINMLLLNNPKQITAAALNVGIQRATNPIIVRLDGHSTPAPNYIRTCVEVLKKSGAKVVGGRIEVKSGRQTLLGEAIAVALRSAFASGGAVYRGNGSARDVDTVPFGCFERETWSKIGGFDESLRTNEDYDFNFRVRQSGGRVRFDPAIKCEYFARGTLRDLIAQYWRYGWWKSQMLRKHPNSIKMRQAIPPIWVAVAICVPFLALVEPTFRFAGVLIWLVYGGALIVAAGCACRSRWRLLVPVIIAFLTIHFAWGIACLAGLLGRQCKGTAARN